MTRQKTMNLTITDFFIVSLIYCINTITRLCLHLPALKL
jgi:hypothetical protein